MILARRFQVALALVYIISPLAARAWMRMRYEDAQVVERSELIVVGALKEDSVVVVPHPHKADEGHSWETHATLLIHEVIKGEYREKELPIVIRYGLDVFIDGGSPASTSNLEKPTFLPAPRKSMAIHDTGNSAMSFSPIADDIQKDHLWFLRHGGEGAQPDDASYGIVDPEDVQPLEFQTYFQSYLAADPEPLVRATLLKQPEIATRAVRYLQHREIERILKEKDPAVRVERLLPYFQSRVDWGFRQEAREGLIAAGEIAGPYLRSLYDQSSGEPQIDIIRMWGQIHYKACAPTLIEVLKRQDQIWAAQQPKLNPGWWNADVESHLTQTRREYYGLVYASVGALAQIRDPSAREVLVQTRRRWAAIQFENPQILEACDQALQALGPAPPPTRN